MNIFENAVEQCHVAVDQIQPALVGLAPQPGGDANQIAVGDLFVAAGVNYLVGRDRCAVHQIERLSFGHLGVYVQQGDFPDQLARLQGKCRTRADQSAAANNADFHGIIFGLKSLRIVKPRPLVALCLRSRAQ